VLQTDKQTLFFQSRELFLSFRNLMSFIGCLFQLLIIFVSSTHLMPSHETAKQETHKLRWTNNAGLNRSSCAVPIVPPRHPNTTREIQKWSNAYSEYFVWSSPSLLTLILCDVFRIYYVWCCGSREAIRHLPKQPFTFCSCRQSRCNLASCK
jgi:hypothetical protein